MWFSENSKRKINSLDHSRRMTAGVLLFYEMLIGEGKYTEVNRQTTLSCVSLSLVRELALKAWENVASDTKFKACYAKILRELRSHVQNL